MTIFLDGRFPEFGDIYQEISDDNELFSAYMVTEIHEGTIILGSGRQVFWADLNDKTKWKFLRNVTQ